MEEESTTAPPIAIASIIAAMALIAFASGHMFAFIPIKLASEGFPAWISGSMVSAMAFGGFLGCYITAYLIRLSGHARIFATYCAAITLSIVLLSISTNPYIWVIARILYGIPSFGLFIVAQSWLHNSSNDRWRGTVMSVFYMSYIVCMGAGSFLLRFMEIDGQNPYFTAIVFATLAIFPVGMTRLPQPPAPPVGSISLLKVWRIAPVGLAGMVAVGGTGMMIIGFAPIWATANNYSKDDIALMMSLMQMGMIFVQLPMGYLSDRIDRRVVLLIAITIVGFSATLSIFMSGISLIGIIALFSVWSGASETVYSVSNAQVNDRADPQDYVMLSSTLLFAYALSAFLIPLAATTATGFFGHQSFMWMTLLIAIVFIVFLIFRLITRRHRTGSEGEIFIPSASHAPYAIEPFEVTDEYSATFWTDAVG